jgi:hypothetical protein
VTFEVAVFTGLPDVHFAKLVARRFLSKIRGTSPSIISKMVAKLLIEYFFSGGIIFTRLLRQTGIYAHR